jgi:hypothetical protein
MHADNHGVYPTGPNERPSDYLKFRNTLWTHSKGTDNTTIGSYPPPVSTLDWRSYEHIAGQSHKEREVYASSGVMVNFQIARLLFARTQ